MEQHNGYNNTNQQDTIAKQIQAQKRLDNERKKQQYKIQCELEFDEIAHQFLNSKNNEIKDELNVSKAAIVRYYKRYWDASFLSSTLLILIATFFISFYTKYALFGVFLVFISRQIYSQNTFVRYFLNDHELNKKEMREIKEFIFYKQLKTSITFIISLLLMSISWVSYGYSTSVFIDSEKWNKIIELLSKIKPFHIENELFAYINLIAIVILFLLKIYEKWSK